MVSGLNNLAGKKVVVGMSGGLDSSVAAALIKRAGAETIGVMLKLEKTGNRCCSLATEKRARLVAEELKIPFYLLSAEKIFQEEVIDDFLAEYQAGRTPNPCVVCNKKIKFGFLLAQAQKIFGADYLSTGHYARTKKKRDGIHLYRGKDKKKDQSYFLWRLNQEQLAKIIFPVGDYTKNEVRQLAEKFNLPVTALAESQEVCFAPDGVKDFLRQKLT
ncbi:MAG: tRNA-specific 2-thiouridylase, partial [Candidatus Berkelbacteria bacterium Licking1014_2]